MRVFRPPMSERLLPPCPMAPRPGEGMNVGVPPHMLGTSQSGPSRTDHPVTAGMFRDAVVVQAMGLRTLAAMGTICDTQASGTA